MPACGESRPRAVDSQNSVVLRLVVILRLVVTVLLIPSMPETLKFRVHFLYQGTVYTDELTALSALEAAKYFNDNKRPDIALGRVELIGPDDGAVREPAFPPDRPFDPLMARRRQDIDEDAR